MSDDAPPPLPDPGDSDPFGSTAPPPLPGYDRLPDPDPIADEAGTDTTSGPESLAREHATESSRTYPCDACGGELAFDIATQKLKCRHCGASHELIEGVGTVDEQDLREALALIRSGKLAHTSQFLDDEKEVVCQNCGGHTTFTGSLTSDKCPYCATPIQRDDVHAAPERLAVDGVLPFAVTQKEAKENIERWINKRWFAPSEFKTYHRTGSFSSVYTAYFTYDADTTTRYTGRRGINYTVTVGHGENRRTETRTRWHAVQGSVFNSFDDITVFANEGFERKRVEKLEPWPTEQSKAYSAEYVAGHLCRTYDHDVEECLPEATSVMEGAITTSIRRDIGGDQQQIVSKNIHWQKMTYKHLLLPMWLLTVMYMGKPFQVYMNGVTGEVHGARPYSKVKIIAAIVVALAVIAVIVVAVNASGGSG